LIVQQDLAPSHAAVVNQELLQECGIEVLEWPGNSPDLNMIEPAWPWIKRNSGHYEGFKSKKDTPSIWLDLWDSLPQEMIRRWIERIPTHIQKVVEKNGCNGYREGLLRRLNKEGQVVNRKGEVIDEDGGVRIQETEGDDSASLNSFEEALAAIDK
jgi:transposase